MLRKHINSFSRDELEKIPFHSWDCITLRLDRRDVDLVIKDEKQMSTFVKFLIYSLQTLDGQKESAKPLLDQMKERDIEKIKK